MRSIFALLLLGVAGVGPICAQGRLVPTNENVPPLSLARHEVKVSIEDQVAVTRVEQTFRNPTGQALEAVYVFPVPKGASVKKFTMWVDGKETPGELVEAEKARSIYTDIVRRTKDPGLLEYMGNNLLKVRVFPVPAHGEQKLAVCYTSIASSDTGMVEYIYPLKADGNAFRSVEKFTLEATLKAQQPIQNVYSPTHAVTIRRPNDREAFVRFDGKQETLDKDFQLYYSATGKDVGLTALTHRAESGKDGYFMLLVSPRAELSKTQHVPRDVVFVLDTSGSMAGKRIEQAKNALKFCLRNLNSKDRFGMIHFATVVNKYQDNLLDASQENIARAQKWVDNLEATGSTCIDDALSTALAMRPTKTTRTAHKLVQTTYNENHDGYMESKSKVEKVAVEIEENRSFTIVFFTDGQPTIGECDPEKIVKNVVAKNTASTRIFTFGVGDDVNACLLDQLADKTSSVSTFVRESEDIEAKVSSFYSKISHPVMTNLKLKVGNGVTISEVYPPQLPDLFHGSQLVVLGRYSGKGHAAVTLTGTVGNDSKEFNYEVHFRGHTSSDKAFVEDLWARRKVGYLLDQIRVNGESKEVKDEVIALAKKYGITTPYTSYLVAPDQPAQQARGQFRNGTPPIAMPLAPRSAAAPGQGYFTNTGYAAGASATPVTNMPPPSSRPSPVGALQDNWNQYIGSMPTSPIFSPAVPTYDSASTSPQPSSAALELTPASVALRDRTKAVDSYAAPQINATAQSGREGVDLALVLNEMRNQQRCEKAAVCRANGRTCHNVGGVWTDEAADAKMAVVKIKAQSAAYFRMLERHPEMKEVFQLGNRIAWVTPNRNVLVIDAAIGQETMSDADIDQLFVAKK